MTHTPSLWALALPIKQRSCGASVSRDSAFFSSVRSHHKGSSLVSTSAVPPLSPSLFLSPSPLSLLLFFFLSPHLHFVVFPQLTYSHCIYCWTPFSSAATDHSLVTPVASSFVHLPLTLVNLISRMAAEAALQSHSEWSATTSTPATNRCVFTAL